MTEDQTAEYTISKLEDKAGNLQEAGLLASVRDSLEDIDTTLSHLPARLHELRTRGYVFKSYLENQIASLQADWPSLKTRVQREIDNRVRDLKDDLARAEQAVRGLQSYKSRSLSSAQSAIDRAEGELESVERRVTAANDAVNGMFDTKSADVYEINAQVDKCMDMFDLADKASFGFRPGEALVETVKVQWLQDERKEGPKGILFLTDQRILFEQREKVAKKKILFITTSSEQVQELQWEAPLGALVTADASEQRKALIMKKEQLALEFKPPATVRKVLMQLSADSEAWQTLINRVLSGDIEQERVAGAAEVAAEAVSAIQVPTKCPSCGASLDVEVIKGMTAVKCIYCGTSIPLTG
ncbi:MAG: hypothetical protein JXA89_06245 [Anaerolineae bacterium]|nr:hypothetical protein [Anaerolineae bacterium]